MFKKIVGYMAVTAVSMGISGAIISGNGPLIVILTVINSTIIFKLIDVFEEAK